MGRVTAIAAAALLVLVAAACGERREPTGPAAELYPVTVPSAVGAKPLVVRAPFRRIAVVAPSVVGVLNGLGAHRALAGIPLAQNKSVDVSRLRRLRPDLIVASSTTDDATVRQAHQAVPSVPVYTAPDDSVRGVEETITDLGVITATQGAASRLVREIETKRVDVQTRLKSAPAVRVFLTTAFLKALATFQTVSNQSLQGDLLREAGGFNVAGDSTEVAAAQLVHLNPRWIIATSDSNLTLKELAASRVLKKLAALKSKRFTTVDARLLQPGARIGEGLVALAKTLHPNAFR